jgi:hypothetical protein
LIVSGDFQEHFGHPEGFPVLGGGSAVAKKRFRNSGSGPDRGNTSGYRSQPERRYFKPGKNTFKNKSCPTPKIFYSAIFSFKFYFENSRPLIKTKVV